MTEIHLDTDIGGDTDDLCALAMILKWPGVDIVGVTTVADDRGKRAGYTKYVLRMAGRENIPVRAGADISQGFYRPTPGFPIETEYWPEPVAPAPNTPDEALELLRVNIERGATIVAIGPYTNLYLLDKKYPGILQRANLFLMGGYVYPVRAGYPTWGNAMDWNIQVDVASAKYVIENSNPTLVPLTVTVETAFRRAYLDPLRQSGNIGRIMAMQAEAVNSAYDSEGRIGKSCFGLPKDILNFQHDPLACAIALGYIEGVGFAEVPLKLEIVDNFLTETPDEQGKVVRLVTMVNGNAFNEFWLKTMTGL